uniref:Uncharacterized protein n=1 Tax=Oryza rufipogon TaxID=4529 RepID=A0A0E0QLP3_ORYRU
MSATAKGGSDSSAGSSGSTPSSPATGRGGSDSSDANQPSPVKERGVVLSELLGHIHGYYKAALGRLPVEETPALIPPLLDAGVCFGLMDPISNIIVNTVSEPLLPDCTASEEEEEDGKSRKRKRGRDEAILSEIAADASCIRCFPPRMGRCETSPERRRNVPVAQRSLEGLVTFLICYFRHLPVSEALHYLLLTKADLLAAVHLIEYTRGIGGRLFPISSPTTEVALRCAAISASHPDPPAFAARSLSLASPSSQILTDGCYLSLDAIHRLHEFLQEPLKEPPDFPKPVRQAALRLNHYIKGISSLNKFPHEFTDTLRTLLLEKIHVLYLKAIARLPRDDLRRRYHHSLLKAGHCFGPANDRVSNIILNTIWYDTTFPPHEELKLDMICTNSLVRIECRSLNGLLAFLHNLFPALSEHDAMMYLFHSNANLEQVTFRAMCDHDISCSHEDAYKAAADAAWHPHPDAQAEFAVSTHPMLLPIDKPSLAISRTLTSSEVELISRYFSQKSYPAKSVPSVPELVPRADELVKRSQQNFMANQYFIRRKVKAALKRYAKEKGTEYELHVICGTNFDVPENGRYGYFRNRKGFPYAHVNFLARPKGSQRDNTAPSLFFLECSNGEEDIGTLFSCCTELESPTDSGRCFHCECKGTKIVHPAIGTYRGRETDFEEMSCGKQEIDSKGLIISEKMAIEFVGLCEDDIIYFDPSKDYDFALGLNNLVREDDEALEELHRDIAECERMKVCDMSCEPDLLAEITEDVLQDCQGHLVPQC